MQWAELSVQTEESAVKEISSILGRFGQGGTAVEEWESEADATKSYVIKIYLPNKRNLKKTECEINLHLSSLPFKVELAKRLVKPEDWINSLKRHFGIREIGERFIIKPSWITDNLPDSTRVLLELDPGAAFGTGLHPTTRLCLLRLEKVINSGMKVFDLGTGTGILSIAAAKLGAKEVLSVDIDAVSVTSAKNNILKNGVGSKVNVRRGTLSLNRQKFLKNSCDLVLANVSVKVITALAVRIAAILKTGGRAVCSGISNQGLDEVLISLVLAGLELEAIDREEEWYAVTAKKPRLD